MARRTIMVGLVVWTRPDGYRSEGEAQAIWHREDDGRINFDINFGEYLYGVDIPPTGNEGCWSLHEYSQRGDLTATLHPMPHDQYEIRGKWIEQSVEYDWSFVSSDAAEDKTAAAK